MTGAADQNPYDRIPYLVRSYVQTSPDRIATMARLFGVATPDVESCRVLELACGSGWNIIPMAEGLPESVFVGIDYSGRQIAEGQGVIAELGLKNITLQHLNILDIGPDMGQFDYIIAHGVYSWVPQPVREHLLKVCRQNLAPQGVAYVSYNTKPGWRVLGILRDMIQFQTADVVDPAERAHLGMETLNFVMEEMSGDRFLSAPVAAAAKFLKTKLDGLGPEGPVYLLHDLLEEVNEPFYFAEFLGDAERHGLQYLADAHLPDMMQSHGESRVVETVREMSRDWLDVEQYMDFMTNRTFRATLLCHEGIEVNRRLSAEYVEGLFVASRARPIADEVDIHAVSVERFRSINKATLSTEHPVSKAAMVFLGQIWPKAAAFDTLQKEAYGRLQTTPSAEEFAQDRLILATTLLRAYSYSETLVGLHAYAPPIVAGIGERPVARATARVQAAQGDDITNLYHETITLDPLTHSLLPLLDGSRDRMALLTAMRAMIADGRLTLPNEEGTIEDDETLEELLDDELRKSLSFFSYAGVLVG